MRESRAKRTTEREKEGNALYMPHHRTNETYASFSLSLSFFLALTAPTDWRTGLAGQLAWRTGWSM